MKRFILALSACIAGVLGFSAPSGAQTYPTRAVRIIVPFPPGEAADTIARLVAPVLSQRMGQQFVVDNRPGAAGQIGLQLLKQAPAEATIASVRHCGDSYFVTNASGQTRAFWEFNLRFKTDTSATGPAPGKPVVVGQGMQGDRAQVVFSSVGEMARFIQEKC